MSLLKKLGDTLDKVRSIYDPAGAMQRQRLRSLMYGYNAGVQSRKDLPFASFDLQAETMNRMSRHTLRARARDLERNSPLTGGIINAWVNNVVGTGFNMQARSDNEKFNDRIEELWEEWCHAENCDWTKRQSLDDMLAMIVERMFIDGGILMTFPIDMEREIPLTIQLHEVDDLAIGDFTFVNKSLDKNHIYMDGVEMTPEGVPIAYWLQSKTPNGELEMEPERFMAEDVIFLWNRTRPSQHREITPMARTIVATKDLTDYNEAVAFQQKTAACVTAFVESEYAGMSPGIGRVQPMERAEPVSTLKGGSVQHLNPGEKVKAFIPTGQAAEVENYFAIQQRMIAADCGLSLESTSRNVERVNYSSARQNLLADGVTYAIQRKFIIEHFLRPLFRRFVDVCDLHGLLKGTGFDSKDKQYYSAVWLAPSLGWIDPKKEAEADNLKLANGGMGFAQYCAGQGVDWKERIDEMAEVQAYAKSKGVSLGFWKEDKKSVESEGVDSGEGEEDTAED